MQYKGLKPYSVSKIGFYFLLLSFFISCKRNECEEKIPSIAFKSFTINDSLKKNALAIVEFYDCDGDVGLNSSDTLSPYNKEGDYHYNFYMYYWEKQKGIWTKRTDFFPAFYYRVPRIEANNANPLKGEIEIKMTPYYILSPYDTIKFEIVLLDRALNKSNAVFTPEVVKP